MSAVSPELVELGIGIAAVALLVVAGSAAVGPRLRIPAPLILVVLGIVISALPFVPRVDVPPELVLAGILPPLLYSSSVALPAMDLRREFGVVSILSVVLVIASSLLLGLLFVALIPGLDYGWAVALGAVISPTDAVATTIAKGADISHRITAILEGESLLNDASALVILRAAIAGAGIGISLWQVAGQFVWSLVVAIVVGVVVGRVALSIRSRIADPTVNTVISFTIPFLVSLPVELLHGSGLVAAVAAGLVVGRRAPRMLSPQQRRNDENNWATVSLVLEGAIFLLMGLAIAGIVTDAGASEVPRAIGLAAIGLLAVLVVRAGFVAPLLGWLHLSAGRREASRDRVVEMQRQLEAGEPVVVQTPRGERRFDRGRRGRAFDAQAFGRRVTQVLADIDYFAASPLGAKEGAVVVWAGMRGAVTVAAAQTIPTGPGQVNHGLLLLIAFGVAALSLLVQGGTLAAVIRLLKPAGNDEVDLDEQRAKVLRMVQEAGDAVPEQEGESRKEHMLRRLKASRSALLDARDLGVYDSAILGHVLATVDSGQITLEMQGGPQG